jgi:hypothetical protein
MLKESPNARAWQGATGGGGGAQQPGRALTPTLKQRHMSCLSVMIQLN